MQRSANHIVLWGHTLEDYTAMFDLSDKNLNSQILDYGAGPASFNVQLRQHDGHVISVDELYALPLETLHAHVNEEFDLMLTQINEQPNRFVWTHFDSLERLKARRQLGIEQFIRSFEEGKSAQHYLAAPMTTLPFEDDQFDLMLCSHYLFGDRHDPSLAFHIDAIKEALRVAQEVRIFPLLDAQGELSPLLGPLMMALQQDNFGVEVKEVNYAFQRNGNAMLRVWHNECLVHS